MKRSIGKKLLAGIVSLSMILGVPVAGYSQEDAQTETALILLEDAAPAEEVLAGAGTVEETVPEEDAAEISVAEDITEEEPAEAGVIAAPAEEAPAEELPDDGIILEPEDGEDLALAAAEDETTTVTPKEVATAEELNNAIKQAKEGAVIQLTAHISTSSSVFVDNDSLHMEPDTASISIDLNGYTLSVNGSNSLFVGTGKTLTLSGGTFKGRLFVKGGTLELPAGVNVNDAAGECLRITENGTVNVKGAMIESAVSSATQYAVQVTKGTLNLSSGSVKSAIADRAVVLLNGTSAVFNMTGGTILSEKDTAHSAIVIAAGNMTMSGGTVTSSAGSAINVYSLSAEEKGSFQITKGTVRAADDALVLEEKGSITIKGEKGGSGMESSTRIISSGGYAIYDTGEKVDSRMEISGGYLEGNGDPIYSSHKEKFITVTTDAVGFSSSMNGWREYLPDINCRTKANSAGVYTIYKLTADTAPAGYIRNNLIYYTESVQEAMDVILKDYGPKDGDTVRILKDIESEPAILIDDIDRTLDLNGHTLKTQLTVKDSTVTIRNGGSAGELTAYTDDYALIVDEGADVTLDSTLKVTSPGYDAVSIGGSSSKTYKLTVKNTITAEDAAVFVSSGNCTVDILSAKLTGGKKKEGTGLQVGSSATGAVITVKDSTLAGGNGIYAMAGDLTIKGCMVTGTAEPEGNPSPNSTWEGAAIVAGDLKLTIESGTFKSDYANVLRIDSLKAGSKVSGGTFNSAKENWDAVVGTPTAGMFTGGTYYPNKVNDMGAGVDTASYALAGAKDGTFYVLAYDKVMAQIYSANASATSFVIGAGAAGKLITGCKVHTKFTNLSGADLDLLIGTDDKITKNKIKLPKDAEELVIHNDLEALTKTGNATPTCTLPSVNKDCWYCTTLKKFYKDADGKEEADDSYFKEPATGHKWGAYDASGWRTCSVCGEKEQMPYQISGFPKKLKVKAAGGKKLTVSWKKPTKSQLKKIKGVYIEVATDSAFTNIVKTKKVKKAKTSFTFKLKKKTQYYVRVRFYNGAKISRWSPVRARKTKG